MVGFHKNLSSVLITLKPACLIILVMRLASRSRTSMSSNSRMYCSASRYSTLRQSFASPLNLSVLMVCSIVGKLSAFV